MTKSSNPAQNPFAFWQESMAHWMPTACTPGDKPTATLEPFSQSKALANPMVAAAEFWQQYFAFWQSVMMPQQQSHTPKVTIDFGSPAGYMQAMQQWQQMWMKGMGGK